MRKYNVGDRVMVHPDIGHFPPGQSPTINYQMRNAGGIFITISDVLTVGGAPYYRTDDEGPLKHTHWREEWLLNPDELTPIDIDPDILLTLL